MCKGHLVLYISCTVRAQKGSRTMPCSPTTLAPFSLLVIPNTHFYLTRTRLPTYCPTITSTFTTATTTLPPPTTTAIPPMNAQSRDPRRWRGCNILGWALMEARAALRAEAEAMAEGASGRVCGQGSSGQASEHAGRPAAAACGAAGGLQGGTETKTAAGTAAGTATGTATGTVAPHAARPLVAQGERQGMHSGAGVQGSFGGGGGGGGGFQAGGGAGLIEDPAGLEAEASLGASSQ